MGKFKLEKTGDVEHVLRKISLDDHEWFREKFGQSLDQVFGAGKDVRLSAMVGFIFHLLVDKSHFLPITEKVEDDETMEEKEVRVSRSRVFARAIVGVDEQVLVMAEFMKTMGMSLPDDVKSVPEEKPAGGAAPSKKKRRASPGLAGNF